MKSILKYIFLIPLAYISIQSKAQTQIVTSEIDTDKIQIGEQFNLKISVQTPEKEEKKAIFFPKLPASLKSIIEIIKTTSDTSKKTINKIYTFTSFDTSQIIILPSLPVIINQDTFYTNNHKITLIETKVDTSKVIYDIHRPINPSFNFKDWIEAYWHWLVFIFLIALVGLFGYLYLKKRKKQKALPKVIKPIIPLHQEYIKKLEALKETKEWESGLKEFHVKISIITREYIEKRFGIKALELTSNEIISNLKTYINTPLDIQIINQTLNLSDLVKFAKERPGNLQNIKAIDDVISFILKHKVEDTISKDHV